MTLADRIVPTLPLRTLWTPAEVLGGVRLASVSAADVAELLRTTTVFFMVADVGHKLRWIDETDRLAFWKTEALPHLVDSPDAMGADEYPGGYAYVASMWSGTDTAPIILLEKYYRPTDMS